MKVHIKKKKKFEWRIKVIYIVIFINMLIKKQKCNKQIYLNKKNKLFFHMINRRS